MTSTKRAILALFVALAVIVGTSGLAFAAAPTVDSESTATSSTSELNDGNTITYNESTETTLQASFDSSNGAFKILQNGTELSEFQNESAAEITVTNGSANYLNLTLADDETGLSGVEADAGESVALEYRMLNDTSLSNPDTSNISVTWANDANTSFVRVESGDTETGDVSRFASLASSVPLVGDDNTTDPAKVEESDIGVNGADQDQITVWVEDSSAQDALDETNTEADGVAYMGSAEVDGTLVPIISAESAAPDWVDTNEDAYVMISDDGERVDIYNAGDVVGDSAATVDVDLQGHEQLNFGEIRTMLSNYGETGVSAVWTAATNGELVTIGDQFEG